MRAAQEIARLQARLAAGQLPPDEPLFVLRAQDLNAYETIMYWAALAEDRGTPQEKVDEAHALAKELLAWPVKQVPGRPETRVPEPGARQ